MEFPDSSDLLNDVCTQSSIFAGCFERLQVQLPFWSLCCHYDGNSSCV